METLLVNSRVQVGRRGQSIAFWLSIFFGIIALILGYTGHDWLAGTIGVSTIIGLAVIFVLGREPGKSSTSPDKTVQEESRAVSSTPTKKKKPNSHK